MHTASVTANKQHSPTQVLQRMLRGALDLVRGRLASLVPARAVAPVLSRRPIVQEEGRKQTNTQRNVNQKGYSRGGACAAASARVQ